MTLLFYEIYGKFNPMYKVDMDFAYGYWMEGATWYDTINIYLPMNKCVQWGIDFNGIRLLFHYQVEDEDSLKFTIKIDVFILQVLKCGCNQEKFFIFIIQL